MTPSQRHRLPDLVAQGHLQAGHILNGLSHHAGLGLRTGERVLSVRAVLARPGQAGSGRLVQGDDLLVLAALLAGDAETPSLRGQVHLAWLQPPTADAPADELGCLATLTPRLVLQRELLADTGLLCLVVPARLEAGAAFLLDTVFGGVNRIHEARRRATPGGPDAPGLLVYAKDWRRANDTDTDDSSAPPAPAGPLPGNHHSGTVRWHGHQRDAQGHLVYDVQTAQGLWRIPANPATPRADTRQGPEHLLRRLLAGVPPDSTLMGLNASTAVATTLAAPPHGRHWVVSAPDEAGATALREHLHHLGAPPFVCQAIDHQGLPESPAVHCESDGAQDVLTVNLQDCLARTGVSDDPQGPAAQPGPTHTGPWARIAYWAVDPDHDGRVFRCAWQDHRGLTRNEGSPLGVATSAVLRLPHKEGPRRVCVRAIDMFGFEMRVSFTIESA